MTKTTRALIVGLACATLPACATVDLADVATPRAEASEPEQTNVVQRAVAKLRAAFAQRGFGPDTSKRNMHAAADMLLNGLNTTDAAAASYNDTAKDAPAILADVRLARRHIEQTTRAAEIYLEVAPRDRDLIEELRSLELALVASEGAARDFATALDTETEPADLVALRGSVDSLRRVTDDFGMRVRQTRSSKIALSMASRDIAN